MLKDAEPIILIVDDTPENIDILNDVLKNYKRKIATNGERALKIANASSPPDIILLDIMMPGMDGYEVCRQLKATEKTRDIPVIFITAMNEVENETKGLEMGAVDFITKPISPPVVKARVKNHLDLKNARERLEAQNNLLESRNKYITDSINYAKRIQTAILPHESRLTSLFPESFIFFSPKDIVSGDFYWISEINDEIIIAVGDCTGHGVPGAFMSMIGNTLLNEIVNEKRITDPAEILNNLNQGIISELQKDKSGENIDGMDIGLCAINRIGERLKYAGAYRNLIGFSNGDYLEIKGDKKSIGEKKKSLLFSNKELSLKEDMILYLTTDGFVDQHGSDNNKFGKRRLRELLRDIYNYDIKEQKRILINEFTNHKEEQIQRDDVTIVGFKP